MDDNLVPKLYPTPGTILRSHIRQNVRTWSLHPRSDERGYGRILENELVKIVHGFWRSLGTDNQIKREKHRKSSQLKHEFDETKVLLASRHWDLAGELIERLAIVGAAAA